MVGVHWLNVTFLPYTAILKTGIDDLKKSIAQWISNIFGPRNRYSSFSQVNEGYHFHFISVILKQVGIELPRYSS